MLRNQLTEKDGKRTVELLVAPKGIVHYTLDGSEPRDGSAYDGPITIGDGDVLLLGIATSSNFAKKYGPVAKPASDDPLLEDEELETEQEAAAPSYTIENITDEGRFLTAHVFTANIIPRPSQEKPSSARTPGDRQDVAGKKARLRAYRIKGSEGSPRSVAHCSVLIRPCRMRTSYADGDPQPQANLNSLMASFLRSSKPPKRSQIAHSSWS